MDAPPRRLWLLNFDADDELARPAGYSVSKAVLARFENLVTRVEGLVPGGDLVLAEWRPTDRRPVLLQLIVTEACAAIEARVLEECALIDARGLEGCAFSPTPRARSALQHAGATILPAPTVDILRRVNHRAFAAELGQTLPDARFVRTMGELEATLPVWRGPWVLKRPFGYAGKGRVTLRGNDLEPWLLPFVRASFDSDGGLQVEPWVERSLDVALHGFLSRQGELVLGEPTLASVDEHGAWRSSRRAGAHDLDPREHAALFIEAERTANALRGVGYFGPFGIDAFRYEDGRGGARFNPRCEINARYSMGWAIGMGDRRPDLLSAGSRYA